MTPEKIALKAAYDLLYELAQNGHVPFAYAQRTNEVLYELLEAMKQPSS